MLKILALLMPLIAFAAKDIEFLKGDNVKCLYIIKGESRVRTATGKVVERLDESINVSIDKGREDISKNEYLFPIKSCTVFEIVKKEKSHYEIIKKEVVKEVIQLVDKDEKEISQEEADEIKRESEERKRAKKDQEKLIAEVMKTNLENKVKDDINKTIDDINGTSKDNEILSEYSPKKKDEEVSKINKKEKQVNSNNFIKDMDVEKEPKVISRSVFEMIFKGE